MSVRFINTWKKQLQSNYSEVFGAGRKQQSEDFEVERDKLYSQIGRLKVEVDWLIALFSDIE